MHKKIFNAVRLAHYSSAHPANTQFSFIYSDEQQIQGILVILPSSERQLFEQTGADTIL